MSSKKHIGKDNMFKGFDLEPFKKITPPKNDSKKTKEELKYIGNIKLDKRFFQEKDDILGNFLKFLDSKKIEYDKKELKKILSDAVGVILELKEYFKRPRPFKIEPKFSDPNIESTKGYSYPSGHSTQSNLLSLVLSKRFPKYKKEFDEITKNIVFSRQMAKVHYPSDIKFGEKLAKELFNHLYDNDIIKVNLKESIKKILREELNVPQPGESSGKALSQDEMGNMDCDTDYLTIDEILDGRIQRIPYYKEVLQDVLNDDYSWGVTKKVVEYARYMKQNPKSLRNLPPIIVVNDVIQDGAHRISAIFLLQNYMDENNPLWDEIELEVKFCYK